LLLNFQLQSFVNFKFRSLVTASYHTNAAIDMVKVLTFMLIKCVFEIIFLIAYYDRVIYAHVLVNVAKVVYFLTSFQTDNFSFRRQF
jgi:hypothetical protein